MSPLGILCVATVVVIIIFEIWNGRANRKALKRDEEKRLARMTPQQREDYLWKKEHPGNGTGTNYFSSASNRVSQINQQVTKLAKEPLADQKKAQEKANQPASVTKRAVAGTIIGGVPGAIIGAASAIDKNNKIENEKKS